MKCKFKKKNFLLTKQLKDVLNVSVFVNQADLVSRLDRKLKVLREEQIALTEETAVNETLGVSVADRVKVVAKPQEANKFKTHVQEVGHITSLLLSLSGRLARAENALLDLVIDHPEKVQPFEPLQSLGGKRCRFGPK